MSDRPLTTPDSLRASVKLRESCKGNPDVTIKWPHRLLHEAADEIDRLATENERLRAALTPTQESTNDG